MKRLMVLVCVVGLLLTGVAAGVVAEGNRELDTWSQRDTIEIKELEFKWESEIENFNKDGKTVAPCISQAWYNLLKHELSQKTPINETIAAKIYRAFKKGPAVACLTASDYGNQYFNVIFAMNEGKYGKCYWIEWDIENQSMRVAELWGMDKHRSEKEFMQDRVLNTYMLQSTGDNADYSVAIVYGAKSGIVKVFDAVYKEANNNKRVPIR